MSGADDQQAGGGRKGEEASASNNGRTAQPREDASRKEGNQGTAAPHETVPSEEAVPRAKGPPREKEPPREKGPTREKGPPSEPWVDQTRKPTEAGRASAVPREGAAAGKGAEKPAEAGVGEPERRATSAGASAQSVRPKARPAQPSRVGAEPKARVAAHPKSQPPEDSAKAARQPSEARPPAKRAAPTDNASGGAAHGGAGAVEPKRLTGRAAALFRRKARAERAGTDKPATPQGETDTRRSRKAEPATAPSRRGATRQSLSGISRAARAAALSSTSQDAAIEAAPEAVSRSAQIQAFVLRASSALWLLAVVMIWMRLLGVSESALVFSWYEPAGPFLPTAVAAVTAPVVAVGLWLLASWGIVLWVLALAAEVTARLTLEGFATLGSGLLALNIALLLATLAIIVVRYRRGELDG